MASRKARTLAGGPGVARSHRDSGHPALCYPVNEAQKLLIETVGRSLEVPGCFPYTIREQLAPKPVLLPAAACEACFTVGCSGPSGSGAGLGTPWHLAEGPPAPPTCRLAFFSRSFTSSVLPCSSSSSSSSWAMRASRRRFSSNARALGGGRAQ